MGSETIVVTGAGGRIGSHLTRSLLSDGHVVRAFGLEGERRLEKLEQFGADVVIGDLEQADTLPGLVRGADVVCHLAAALTTHDVTDDRFVDVNLRGTFNLLAAVCEAAPDLRRFVYTSSDAVYWTGGGSPALYLPVDECHPRRPGTVYGATKVGAEELCRAFAHSYGVPFSVMRPSPTAEPGELVDPGSVFGRRWFVAPAIHWLSGRDQLSSDEADLLETLQNVRGDGYQLFSLVDVDGRSNLSMLNDARDAAEGMRAILRRPEAAGEAFNIGAAAPHLEHAFVTHLGQQLSLEVAEVRNRSVRPSWYISSAKARGVLDYRPTRSVFDMIEEAVATGGR